MKNDNVMYEMIYSILKYKIESGLIPDGAQLPSRADLCKEIGTSEKSVRRAVKMLAADGIVKTEKRKRPTVTFDKYRQNKREKQLQKADAATAGDILRTGTLLYNPVIYHGLSLCSGSDWNIPENIIEKMDPRESTAFWRLSNKFWSFFVARTGNDLIFRTVVNLGLLELDTLPGTYELRVRYLMKLKEFLCAARSGGDWENFYFEDMSSLYGFYLNTKEFVPICKAASDSPFRIGTDGIGQRISKAEERYSRVYMDILGLIMIGRYRPGDRLPSHAKMRQIYGVSVDTVLKAVQILQKWGVVTAIRGKGIFVAMDRTEMKKIHIDPELIACQVRRYLDSLELMTLTIEGVTAHAAEIVTLEEAQDLYDKINKYWNDTYLYQMAPILMLEFIVDHIQYGALKSVYDIVQKHYHIGRSIPKLVSNRKTQSSCEIFRRCIEAVNALIEGDTAGFARKSSDMFQYTRLLIIAECKRLGYWEAAMQMYDGSILWK